MTRIGAVLADDFSEVKKRFFGRLPVAAPVAVAGKRLVAASVTAELLR